jgi:uncharacterized protein
MTKKPTENEDEYFARLEIEKKREWEKERAASMEQAEKNRLRELHHMKCPKCGMDLHTIDYRGLKLDRCVSCNGTWFDPGELDELLGQDESFFNKMKTFFG